MDFNQFHHHIKKSIISYFSTRLVLHRYLFSEALLSYQRAQHFEHLSLKSFSSLPYRETLEIEDSHQRNAIWYFLNAALQGYSTAQFKLGMLYLNGQLGLDPSIAKAEMWLNLAANQGHSEAQIVLSKMHMPS
ncbi:tetratricopeptide repeat protein [Acinetobacter sp. CFCC 10889]|uniref:tetratricopeptide repeat protein n=1 Tax=Acinetobacter sp. CFCC 10889 TaxID=1775557 RepID=UPI00148B4F76|nr:tetratricopeptide repeat protein [Acinetobacter sp. CFCC 10889]